MVASRDELPTPEPGSPFPCTLGWMNVSDSGKLVFPVRLETNSTFWNRTNELVSDPWALYPPTVEAKILAVLRSGLCTSLGFSPDLRIRIEPTASRPALHLRAQWSGPHQDSIRIEGSLDSTNSAEPVGVWSLPWREVDPMPTKVSRFSMP